MTRDRVSPELHRAVMVRDRRCVLAKLEEDHRCRDRWGMPHRSDDWARLTVEHVHEGYGMAGKRAKSDMAHLVAMCFGSNVGVPSKVQRAALRAYLADVEGVTK